MSFRGQQHYASTYNGKVLTDNKSDRRFRDLTPQYRNRYNPAREAACRQVGVPYGQVLVGGEGDHIRSHEIHLDNKNASGYLDPELLARERANRRETQAWVRQQKKKRGLK